MSSSRKAGYNHLLAMLAKNGWDLYSLGTGWENMASWYVDFPAYLAQWSCFIIGYWVLNLHTCHCVARVCIQSYNKYHVTITSLKCLVYNSCLISDSPRGFIWPVACNWLPSEGHLKMGRSAIWCKSIQSFWEGKWVTVHMLPSLHLFNQMTLHGRELGWAVWHGREFCHCWPCIR